MSKDKKMSKEWQNDVKGVTKSLRLQKDNDKKIKVKRTDNNLQNTTQKTKGWATRTPIKPVVDSGALEG
jgi:hypothetical protein